MALINLKNMAGFVPIHSQWLLLKFQINCALVLGTVLENVCLLKNILLNQGTQALSDEFEHYYYDILAPYHSSIVGKFTEKFFEECLHDFNNVYAVILIDLDLILMTLQNPQIPMEKKLNYCLAQLRKIESYANANLNYLLQEWRSQFLAQTTH